VGKNRLEAFSDGVLAIIITIMVLEMRPPHGDTMLVLQSMIPIFMCYVLSFVYIGIYWTNHHHMLHAIKHVNGPILLANLHLLFWLSLVPFVTRWMGENHFSALPVALYGFILLMSAIAYFILAQSLIRHHGKESTIAIAIGKDVKGKISLVIYALAVPLSFLNAWVAFGLYIFVAFMWFIPDRRIEKVLQ
jgi:uncharacterized membrane protein